MPNNPNTERHCCDGNCLKGDTCPAFAPGVIDGPHRRPPPPARVARRGAGLVVGCRVAVCPVGVAAGLGRLAGLALPAAAGRTVTTRKTKARRANRINPSREDTPMSKPKTTLTNDQAAALIANGAATDAAMAAADEVPRGYWRRHDGTLTPVAKIKPVDKARNGLVIDLCSRAKAMNALLADFKAEVDAEIDDFIRTSAAEYGVQLRGAIGKGNVTLTSYDGRFKVERQVADKIAFDERLQLAKQQMDECVHRWGKGANDNLKAIVQAAFKTDKVGRVSVGRVLDLRHAKIDDPQWLKALEIVTDSMQAVGSAQYMRFYERDEKGSYQPISLNTAAV